MKFKSLQLLFIIAIVIALNSCCVESLKKSKSKTKTPLTKKQGSSRQSRRGDGTYRTRENERKYLSNKHKFKISGKTHETEHIVGFSVLVRDIDPTLGVNRGIENLGIENYAPAYLEERSNHREHVGTGFDQGI